MASWNEFKEKLQDLTGRAAKKTEEAANIASLKVQIGTVELQMREYYTELGKLTYADLEKKADHSARIAVLIAHLDTCHAKIAKLEAKIKAVKGEKGNGSAEQASAQEMAQEPIETDSADTDKSE